MNGSHLPAGQSIPGGVGGGPGGRGPIDMGQGNGPPRRRAPHQYAALQHQQHQQHQPSYHHQGMPHAHNHNPSYYGSAMNPYASSYYPQIPPHYANGAMSGVHHYMPYNAYQQPTRAPLMHQAYPPIVSSNMQQHPPHPQQTYSRPPQQPSPALSTPPPFQTTVPPPQPVPIPHTPSSTVSSHVAPAPLTPSTPQTLESAPPQPEAEVVETITPFRAPLPWLSRPDLPFPTRTAKSKRRRRILSTVPGIVELPTQQAGIETLTEVTNLKSSTDASVSETATLENTAVAEEPTAPVEMNDPPETPSTQAQPSESAQSTSPTTPVSFQTTHASTAASVTPTKPSKSTPKAAVPAVPILPVIPKTSPKEVKSVARSESPPTVSKSTLEQTETVESITSSAHVIVAEPAVQTAPAWSKPKLWANLFTTSTPTTPSASATVENVSSVATVNGASSASGSAAGNGSAIAGSFSKSNATSLAEALQAYRVSGAQKIAFLEPRGLINTGNMCYMNSVLQVLIFCIPFYDFLDQVGKRAAHSFKSETPLIDAMIMFMREFKVIDSAVSAEQLRRRLKSEELEQYGEPFTPEFVYDAIRKLPRFASMRRGHQQDAEEFLGFLLEALHDECAFVMRHLPESSNTSTAANSSSATPTGVMSPTSTDDVSDWMEVGPRQRAAITRSSGHPTTSSPITKIFGGQLRSEFKVPGAKPSVTFEPYQPLQLDIGSPEVNTIVDALKHLTHTETLHGDFGGRDNKATKQVLIESVPQVLILHLKRFQFDAEGTGTVKIWKKIGYPLDLELPKEIFSRSKRNALVTEGAGVPKYKLIAAVYHHGKNASGGHYTVDVRRQDGREWIRLDDTVIRRVRSEDVAEGGNVDSCVGKQNTPSGNKENAIGGSGNRFQGIGEDDGGDDEGWNKVSSAPATKKWSSIVNGGASNTAAATKGKQVRDNIKDNKVAYLLFYQRV